MPAILDAHDRADIERIARGEQPLFPVKPARTVRGRSSGPPRLAIEASNRGDALWATRAVIAAELEVAPDRFDVE